MHAQLKIAYSIGEQAALRKFGGVSPHIMAALIGAGGGAGIGALTGGEGHRGEGALFGALGGAALGTGGRALSTSLFKGDALTLQAFRNMRQRRLLAAILGAGSRSAVGAVGSAIGTAVAGNPLAGGLLAMPFGIGTGRLVQRFARGKELSRIEDALVNPFFSKRYAPGNMPSALLGGAGLVAGGLGGGYLAQHD